MNITKTINDSTATIALAGWLDTNAALELEKELNALYGGISELTLDLKELEYISSAGLRQILSAYKKMGSDNFAVTNAAPAVMQVFEMTGFARKLNIKYGGSVLEKFYIIDIRTLGDPEDTPSLMDGLPSERKKKCLSYKKLSDRKRSLGAGEIIKRILADFDCTEKLHYGINGKPEAEGIYFNVSHSGDYVIGVASDTPIGCDIEKIDKAPLKIADRFFYDSEKAYIQNHPDKDFAFWQMWTLKESYMKMTGEGMKLGLDSFRISIGDTIAVYRNSTRQDCSFRHYIHDGHSIAVCKK